MAEQQNTVLIVGCGDLGLRLAKRLISQGFNVSAVKRNPDSLPAGIQGVAADISMPETLNGLTDKSFDYIVVATSAGEFTEQAYQRVYVDGLRNVLAVTQPKKRLFLVSSTSVYGQSGGDWVDETSATEPLGFAGRKQLDAEAVAFSDTQNATVVRLSGIYGPGRSRLIEQVYDGLHTLSEPAHYSNRIHIDDAAGMLAFLIDCNESGTALESHYIGCDKSPSALHEVKEWMAEQMDLSNHWQSHTSPKGRGGSKRCNGNRVRELGYEFQYPDFKAGYEPLIREYLKKRNNG